MAFDLIKYAAENHCAIKVAPIFDTDRKLGLQQLVSWHVTIESFSQNGDTLKISKIVPGHEIRKEILDFMIAELGRKKALKFGTKHTAKQLRDREAFFKGE